jgi:hypothetical protein
VILVEVARKAYLASIVPVIVNAVLNEHQIVADIVAFVNKGDFPRSRLGEKQRGKILASWVTRKMRTMAQFGIRDPDSVLSDVNEATETRSGAGSLRNSGSVIASSLRNIDPAPIIPEQRELEQRHELPASSPLFFAELPAQPYNEPMFGSPTVAASDTTKSDDTPTNSRASCFESAANAAVALPNENDNVSSTPVAANYQPPTFTSSFESQDGLPPRVGPKPPTKAPQTSAPTLGDLMSLPSQRPLSGLMLQNNTTDQEEDNWQQEALRHMNLTGT